MAEATSTGGGGGTAGLSTMTGLVSMPLQAGINKKKKKSAKLQRKHQALLNANARENLKQEFINTERQFSYDQRKAALQRERAALESGIFTSDQMYKLQKRIASAQNAINMINAISGGASGVVDYYGSGGPQG